MKRYIATIEAFVYAEDDKEAIEKSKKLAKWANVDDNNSSLIDLVAQDFGSTKNRQVKIK